MKGQQAAQHARPAITVMSSASRRLNPAQRATFARRGRREPQRITAKLAGFLRKLELRVLHHARLVRRGNSVPQEELLSRPALAQPYVSTTPAVAPEFASMPAKSLLSGC